MSKIVIALTIAFLFATFQNCSEVSYSSYEKTSLSKSDIDSTLNPELPNIIDEDGMIHDQVLQEVDESTKTEKEAQESSKKNSDTTDTDNDSVSENDNSNDEQETEVLSKDNNENDEDKNAVDENTDVNPPTTEELLEIHACREKDGNQGVFICHFPPGNPKAFHTLCISVSALNAHLHHGHDKTKVDEKNDHIGECLENEFEK
jgi:hypothetical protein